MTDYVEILPTAAVLLVGLAACALDLRSRRIPNALTFGAAAAALVFHTVTAGVSGLQTAAFGWIVGTALFLPFFLLGGMGGGDVKLLAALGAWLGPREAMWLAIYGSIAGGVLAIGYSLAHADTSHGAGQHCRASPVPGQWLDRVRCRRSRWRGKRTPPGICRPDVGGTDGDAMGPLGFVRRLRSHRGAELIEMAIVTPILMLIIGAIIDFGMLFRSWEAVTNAAREGARVGVLPAYTADDDVRARVEHASRFRGGLGLHPPDSVRRGMPGDRVLRVRAKRQPE